MQTQAPSLNRKARRVQNSKKSKSLGINLSHDLLNRILADQRTFQNGNQANPFTLSCAFGGKAMITTKKKS